MEFEKFEGSLEVSYGDMDCQSTLVDLFPNLKQPVY